MTDFAVLKHSMYSLGVHIVDLGIVGVTYMATLAFALIGGLLL